MKSGDGIHHRNRCKADMNYRHIYHAGNFADLLKHAVLARIVAYLKGKDKAFRVIDTHAGAGLYDLTSEAAQKTGEWQGESGASCPPACRRRHPGFSPPCSRRFAR